MNISWELLQQNWEGIVALCALFIAAWQAWGTRRHNRLSVKPHLATWTNQDDSDGFYKVRFVLLNNGLGPAILKKFRVFFDGKRMGDSCDRAALENKVAEILKQQPGIIRHTISVMGLDFPVPAGYQETLLEIQVPMTLQLDKKVYQDFLDRFDAEFVYQSMYGQRFLYHTYNKEALKSWALKVRLYLCRM